MNISTEEWKLLAKEAMIAAEQSTAERHHVGAALLASDGHIYTGANFEANNHRSTVHAEDAAIASMLMTTRGATVKALMTVASDSLHICELSDFYYTYPCGSCRNLLYMVSRYGTDDETEVWWDDRPVKLSTVYPIGSDSVPVDLE